MWFRATALLMLLFAAGHTFGFLSFRPATPEGRAVWAAMHSVPLVEGHAKPTYGDFYVGFGLSIAVSQIFVAWLSWVLGSMALRGAGEARVIAWGLVALEAAGAVLSLRYFSAAPAVLSLVVAACLTVGAISVQVRAEGGVGGSKWG